MKEYIERYALLQEVSELDKKFWGDWYTDDVVDLVNRQSAADVVEVVRCKDCQYSKFIKSCSKYMCDKRNEGRGELKYSNDFCSDGRKKQIKIKIF